MCLPKMPKIFLAKEELIVFYICETTFVCRVLETNLVPFHDGDSDEQMVCHELKERLRLQSVTNGPPCLEMRINKESAQNGGIKLEIYSNPVTDAILDLLGHTATIKVEMTDLKFIQHRNTYSLPNVSTTDINILKQRDRVCMISRENGAGCLGIWNQVLDELYFEDGARRSNIPITGKITVTAFASLNSCVKPSAATQRNGDLVESAQNLHSVIEPDITIISGDGEAICCHKSALASQSSVLKAMLETEMKEAKTQKIEMQDCSMETISALLDYLYRGELTKPSQNPELAFQLLQTSHMLNVEKLEKELKKILAEFQDSSIPVDLAVQVYMFAKKIEHQGNVALMNKSVLALKCNQQKLMTSTVFKELFETNAAAAMELFQFVLQGYGN